MLQILYVGKATLNKMLALYSENNENINSRIKSLVINARKKAKIAGSLF